MSGGGANAAIDDVRRVQRGGAARALALDLLASVLLEGRPLEDAGPDRGTPEMRAFARRLAATTLRRAGQIEALMARFLVRPLPRRAERTRLLLMLGMAQILFEEVPAHAAVDTAVGLADARMKGLVNAVLRRCAREGPALIEAQDAARLNTPPRLLAGWEAAYGEAAARAVAGAHLGEAPLDLTIRRPDAPGPLPDGATTPTGSLRLARPGAISRMPGYEEGGWWVQDMAAALPARMLGPVAGERALDLCAAPGGKTAQLAAAGARVTAVDRAPERLDAARANFARLGLEAEWIEADAADWRPDGLFPAVLLDAPCSATGTIRRHPDILHRRAGRRLDRLTALQDRLLASAARATAPGGRLVYACCSLEPEEGPERIAAFLAGRPDFVLEPAAFPALPDAAAPDGALRTLPSMLAEQGGMDGFYAARLVRVG